MIMMITYIHRSYYAFSWFVTFWDPISKIVNYENWRLLIAKEGFSLLSFFPLYNLHTPCLKAIRNVLFQLIEFYELKKTYFFAAIPFWIHYQWLQHCLFIRCRSNAFGQCVYPEFAMEHFRPEKCRVFVCHFPRCKSHLGFWRWQSFKILDETFVARWRDGHWLVCRLPGFACGSTINKPDCLKSVPYFRQSRSKLLATWISFRQNSTFSPAKCQHGKSWKCTIWNFTIFGGFSTGFGCNLSVDSKKPLSV